jgi:hypothetical protein
VALCSLVAIGGIFLSMVIFTDPSSPSFFGWFCYIFLMIAAWPFELWFLFHHGAPPAAVTFLLFVTSGLFWAAVVDVLYELKKIYGA